MPMNDTHDNPFWGAPPPPKKPPNGWPWIAVALVGVLIAGGLSPYL